MLYGIQSEDIDAVWPDVVGLIEEAVKTARGKYSLQDLREELETKACQLWIWKDETSKAVIVTQIHSYKRNKCCWIRVATGSGNGDDFKRVGKIIVGQIEDWAREHGCDAMELLVRPGWARVLKDYEMTHLFLERSLK
jgi:hypothetical protein